MGILRKRNVLGLVTALIMFLVVFLPGMAPAGAADESRITAVNTGYSDVSASNADAAYVKYMSDHGIIKGFTDGTFRPAEGLTRAQAAAVMIRAAGKAAVNSSPAFSDVKSDHWAAASIATAVASGYLKGFPDGTFRPDEQLSRAQAISLILRLSGEQPAASLPALTDMSGQHWAANAAAVGIAAGMIGLSPDGKQFMPDAPFTRINMVHALGILITQDPSLYKTVLPGKLKVIKGSAVLKPSGSQTGKEITTEITLQDGDLIITAADSSAEISYPDGSSMLLQENTQLSVKESQGRKYIKADGSEGQAVDWLNLELKEGVLFGALATTHAGNTAVDTIGSGRDRQYLLASLQPLDFVAANDSGSSDSPWYQTAKTKKVKVKVDMPWGVAAIRGTFVRAAVDSSGHGTVTCLTGDASVTSNQGTTVQLQGGQQTQLISAGSPPVPPTPMSSQQVQQFNQVQSWVQSTAQNMDQNREVPAPSPPQASNEPTAAGTPQNQQGPQNNTPTTTLQTVTQALQGGSGGTTGTGTNPADNSNSGTGGGGSSDGGHHHGGSNIGTGTIPANLSISSIGAVTASVNQDVAYTPPAQVVATLSDGTLWYVPVTWDNNSPGTATPGVITLNGTVSGYAQTVTLTLTINRVLKIVSLVDMSASVVQQEMYNLPATVQANMNDGTVTNKPVNWSPSYADTSTAGVYYFTGRVSGYSGICTLTLTVTKKVAIAHIEDISANVRTGTGFTLPAAVNAEMDDGTSKTVAVSWNPATADTSKAGTFTFQGTVAGYGNAVTLILTVTQADIVRIGNLSDSIKVGDSYTLPATVEAELSDGTNASIPVSWNPATADTSTAGTFTFHGTIEGYNGLVTLTLEIKPKNIPVTKVTLDKTSLDLQTGETATLTATIIPEDATNKEVHWSTSDSQVATVNNGVVTAVGPGTATITVLAKHDNKKAQCRVTVTAAAETCTAIFSKNTTVGDYEMGTVIISITQLPDAATFTVTYMIGGEQRTTEPVSISSPSPTITRNPTVTIKVYDGAGHLLKTFADVPLQDN